MPRFRGRKNRSKDNEAAQKKQQQQQAAASNEGAAETVELEDDPSMMPTSAGDEDMTSWESQIIKLRNESTTVAKQILHEQYRALLNLMIAQAAGEDGSKAASEASSTLQAISAKFAEADSPDANTWLSDAAAACVRLTTNHAALATASQVARTTVQDLKKSVETGLRLCEDMNGDAGLLRRQSDAGAFGSKVADDSNRPDSAWLQANTELYREIRDCYEGLIESVTAAEGAATNAESAAGRLATESEALASKTASIVAGTKRADVEVDDTVTAASDAAKDATAALEGLDAALKPMLDKLSNDLVRLDRELEGADAEYLSQVLAPKGSVYARFADLEAKIKWGERVVYGHQVRVDDASRSLLEALERLRHALDKATSSMGNVQSEAQKESNAVADKASDAAEAVLAICKDIQASLAVVEDGLANIHGPSSARVAIAQALEAAGQLRTEFLNHRAKQGFQLQQSVHQQYENATATCSESHNKAVVDVQRAEKSVSEIVQAATAIETRVTDEAKAFLGLGDLDSALSNAELFAASVHGAVPLTHVVVLAKECTAHVKRLQQVLSEAQDTRHALLTQIKTLATLDASDPSLVGSAGYRTVTVDRQVDQPLGMMLKSTEGVPGVFVGNVQADGLAAKAGINPGEAVRRVNGVDVRRKNQDEVIALIKKDSHLEIEVGPDHADQNDGNRTVVLKRHEKLGLGLKLATDKSGTRIKSVIENSPAAQTGQLRPDDYILSIDGEDVAGKDHDSIVKLMAGKGQVTLVVSTSPPSQAEDTVAETEFGTVSAALKAAAESETDADSPDGNGSRTIVLDRRKGPLGLKLRGYDTPVGVVIAGTVQGSQAAETGKFTDADFILSINGQDVSNFSHGQLVDLIKTLSGQVVLNVRKMSEEELQAFESRGAGATNGAPQPPIPTKEQPKQQQEERPSVEDLGNNMRRVTLSRAAGPLGLRLRGFDRPVGVMVVGTVPGSQADRSGAFSGSDLIVSVNDTQAESLNHGQLVDLFKQASGDVVIVVRALSDNDVAAFNQRGLSENTSATSAVAAEEKPAQGTEEGAAPPVSGGTFATATLVNSGQGFGLKLRTDEGASGVRIDMVLPDTPAADAKDIQPGQQIISLNGEDVSNASHDHVVNMLKSNKEVTLELYMPPSTGRGLQRRPSKYVDEGETDNAPAVGATAVAANERTVQLTKTNEGLGLRLRTFEGTCDTHVAEVIPNTPAARCKELKVGDLITRINDEDVQMLSHSQTEDRLKATKVGETIVLTVTSRPLDQYEQEAGSRRMSRQLSQKKGRAIRLEQDPSFELFGMDITESYSFVMLTVREVVPGSVFDKAGIRVGDRLDHIGDKAADEMTLTEAQNALDQSEQEATFTCNREFTISKGSQGFGLRLVGSDLPGVRTKEPLEGSPAEQAGIRGSEQLLKIDGQDARHLSHKQVVSKLKGRESATLELAVPIVVRGERSRHDIVVDLSSFGAGARVEGVKPNSPAEKANVRPGMVIVTVDGSQISTVPHEDVRALLAALPAATLGMVIPSAPASPVTGTKRLTPTQEESLDAQFGARNVRRVTLTPSGGKSFGFKLNTLDNDRGTRIGAIDPAGLAYESGQLKQGDALLEVNGRNVVSADYQDVITAFRATSAAVTLVVADDFPGEDAVSNRRNVAFKLAKGSRIGLRLICVPETTKGVFVLEKLPSGAAASTDLTSGDRVLEVNGVDVSNMSYQQTLDQFVGLEPGTVTLSVAFSDIGAALARETLLQEGKGTAPVANRSKAAAAAAFSEIRTVHLYRDKEKGYGLHIRSNPDGTGAIVHNVTANTPASTAQSRGDIHFGDEILTVDGENVSNKPHQDIVDMFRNRDAMSLGIKLSDVAVGEEIYASPIRFIVLQRSEGQHWGIKLKTESNGTGATVLEVLDDGAAFGSGLRAGDEIVSINGQDVETAPHSDIVALFHQSADALELTVIRQGESRTPVRRVVLHRDNISNTFGFQFATTGSLGDQKSVVSMDGESPASLSQLRLNDVILSVNGRPAGRMPHANLVKLLSSCDEAILHVQAPTQPELSELDCGRFRHVTMTRELPSDMFGFALSSAPNAFGLRIGTLHPEGMAARSGLVNVNDVVVEMNHVNVLRCTRDEALSIVRSKPHELKLVLADSFPTEYKRKCVLERDTVSSSWGVVLQTVPGVPGTYIKTVAVGSPAERAGLVAGDRVITIEGEDVSGMEHADVVRKIKADTSDLLSCTWVVSGFIKTEHPTEADRVSSMQSALPNADELATFRVASPLREARIALSADRRSGIKLSTREPHGYVVILSSTTNNMVRKGDYVLSINGMDFCRHGISEQDIREALSSDTEQLCLLLDSQEPILDDEQAPPVLSDVAHHRAIHLRKTASDSGFGVELQTRTADKLTYAVSVAPGSPAANAGVLAGDVICAVNGEQVDQLTHAQVLELISKNPSECTLVVERNAVRRVHLVRTKAGGFGLKIKESIDRPGAEVDAVYVDTPAAETNGVFAGDYILSVNKRHTSHLTYTQVLDMLKASDEVDLVLQPAGVLHKASAAVPAFVRHASSKTQRSEQQRRSRVTSARGGGAAQAALQVTAELQSEEASQELLAMRRELSAMKEALAANTVHMSNQAAEFKALRAMLLGLGQSLQTGGQQGQAGSSNEVEVVSGGEVISGRSAPAQGTTAAAAVPMFNAQDQLDLLKAELEQEKNELREALETERKQHRELMEAYTELEQQLEDDVAKQVASEAEAESKQSLEAEVGALRLQLEYLVNLVEEGKSSSQQDQSQQGVAEPAQTDAADEAASKALHATIDMQEQHIATLKHELELLRKENSDVASSRQQTESHDAKARAMAEEQARRSAEELKRIQQQAEAQSQELARIKEDARKKEQELAKAKAAAEQASQHVKEATERAIAAEAQVSTLKATQEQAALDEEVANTSSLSESTGSASGTQRRRSRSPRGGSARPSSPKVRGTYTPFKGDAVDASVAGLISEMGLPPQHVRRVNQGMYKFFGDNATYIVRQTSKQLVVRIGATTQSLADFLQKEAKKHRVSLRQ